ncbi:peroxisomal bifunctional enzyme-like [Acanthaster planci]|uniref:Peroxisomal bifunctional enzyme n=1 Tax=Acanthaster planci TaxID=133434 RepID=A0A8B7XIH2_ACAPL|nr:peroxisomal bifunctional enzyme-like [Acanthaster planci]XP_022079922.1 peroxisomal bifunctional enzyme-like [Acanthaster planci]XP_022079923.1 peroxisomal bifunctional enzyme-like [Acanthaster planci]XP_022079924.1 peroxisomal bifunctional enzyme-like [Acanthaster planci]XP_022079925.1 peroxisomal bifunctional enzyme-like [Acanthaster planci]XP_022079926.1 peroxisomal bifunctional enzyme-like [Acanthaster planci]
MTQLSTVGNVGVIRMNSPPVNALGIRLRKDIMDCLKRAESDPSIQAIVLCSDCEIFSGGADITEFGTPKAAVEPHLIELLHTIEAAEKPVVAAIHGVALGGALELSLGCHYRIIKKNGRVGFPEVTIGILPGGTGTQRLPRVAGVVAALEIITSGKPLSAQVACAKGIVDKVVEGDIVKEGIAFAQSVVGKPLGPRRISQMKVKAPPNVHQVFEEWRAKLKKSSRGAIAPLTCLESIENAVTSPSYSEGLRKENELMMMLIMSEQSAALRYAFFAERVISRWEVPSRKVSHKTAKPLAVKSAAVIGGGTMGAGIAMALISIGIPTFMIEQDDKFLQRGVETVKGYVGQNVVKGRVTTVQAQKLQSLLKPTLNYADLKNVDIVIEAVFENMKVKKEVFGKLDAVCKPLAILASNTSGLNIDEMASATKRPESVIGMHFFAPAHIMRLVENIHGKQTSAVAMATVMELTKKMGKVGVLVGNCPGFVGNRMLRSYGTEGMFLLEEGCLPYEVDQALQDFGLSMGIFQMSDLSGLDIGYTARKERGIVDTDSTKPARFREGERYCPLADILVEKGHLGQKSGKGYYNYGKPGGRTPQRDPEVEQLIIDFSKKHGIKRRKISAEEIIERCLYPLINEGFKILQEGIASKMEEIDIIWLYGYGWPRHTGGPMYYAKQVGLEVVYERLQHYQKEFPYSKHWRPAELLRKMATEPDHKL